MSLLRKYERLENRDVSTAKIWSFYLSLHFRSRTWSSSVPFPGTDKQQKVGHVHGGYNSMSQVNRGPKYDIKRLIWTVAEICKAHPWRALYLLVSTSWQIWLNCEVMFESFVTVMITPMVFLLLATKLECRYM